MEVDSLEAKWTQQYEEEDEGDNVDNGGNASKSQPAGSGSPPVHMELFYNNQEEFDGVHNNSYPANEQLGHVC